MLSSHQMDLVERLCETVAILYQGRLLAFGAVAALRDEQGGRRLRVELGGCAWAHALDGVVIAEDGRGCLLEFALAADPQQVLSAAQAAGQVSHFGSERQTLTELFRETPLRSARRRRGRFRLTGALVAEGGAFCIGW